jgi:hypothetical protein
MSFHVVSHEMIFNETMCTQDNVYLLIFPWGFYKRDKKDIYYADSVSPELSHEGISVFLNIQDQLPLFLPQGFWRVIYDDQIVTPHVTETLIKVISN